MSRVQPNHFRILAVAPTTRGFGFAIIEGKEALIDWGCKAIHGDKNTQSVAKVERLIKKYLPEVLVLQDASAEHSRRSPRIKQLSQLLIAVAQLHKIKFALISKAKLSRIFFDKSSGTKHDLATILALRFPELSDQLPPKRRPWTSEDSRMDIFDAVALALAFRLKQ